MSMEGDPLNFADPRTQKALHRLRELAPFLWSGSKDLQYDSVINALSTDKVAAVDNWPYGIPVMRDYGKTT